MIKARFRKKMPLLRAVQWDGTPDGFSALQKSLDVFVDHDLVLHTTSGGCLSVHVGGQFIHAGGWVVQDAETMFVMDQASFDFNYEMAEES